jgi:CRISPR-associated protein Csx17
MVDVVLTGCRPEPLASYLKALGVLRLVAEQKDPDAQGFWRGEHFVLRSNLNMEALEAFFVEEWTPTPIIAPWNGGSGFYQKDNKDGIAAMTSAAEPRFSRYQVAIGIATKLIVARGWTERPEGDEKAWLLSALRAQLPDEALAWIDAAVVLGEEKPLFPPLLGTGGNDGRFDFSNNFMQRVLAALRAAPDLVSASLFASPVPVRFQGSMGMYAPAVDARSNPWDFVLLIEGALLFAGAATRRLGANVAGMAFPFHARAAGGNASLAAGDEGSSRDELWLPLWKAPTHLRELEALFSEGRAKVGASALAGRYERDAASSLDFARAISQLGTDRGITAFERVGFHERNGLAYYATPLGRFTVERVASARLLDDLDSWLARYRRAALGDRAPASVASVARALEDAMFLLVAGGAVADVLLALSNAEVSLGRSLTFAENAFVTPAPSLSKEWVDELPDLHELVEARLGAALAQRPGFRRRFLPLDKTGLDWGQADDLAMVFAARAPIDNLHALLLREDVEQQQAGARFEAEDVETRWSDLVQFIDGDVDDQLIERWAMAATLLPPVVTARDDAPWHMQPLPPAAFAVCRLVMFDTLGKEEQPMKRVPMMMSRACAGNAIEATSVALRRLNGLGLSLPVTALVESQSRMRRIAAALAFPLSLNQRRRLESLVLAASSLPEQQ